MLEFINDALANAGTQGQIEILRSIRSMIIDLRLCKAGLDKSTSQSLIEYAISDEIAYAIERGALDSSAMRRFTEEEKPRVETVTQELLHYLDLRDEFNENEDDQ